MSVRIESVGGAAGVAVAALLMALGGCGGGTDPAPPPAPTAPATATAAPAFPTATPSPAALAVVQPADRQLSLAGPVAVALQLPARAVAGSLQVTLDGTAVTAALTQDAAAAGGTLPDVTAGQHHLVAVVSDGQALQRAEVYFETVDLQHPDDCEVLNNAECLLPYPSSRFLVPADTPTGWRVQLPAIGMPKQAHPLSTAPYGGLDGFSPTVQILMHFPGGVDVAASHASRLLAATRTYDLTSLQPDSPTVLLDADTGERILHFVETDARAADPARQVLFLRPALSLTPQHRYIVAVRNLVHPGGAPVTAEPAFAALRDARPTDIAAIASRRAHFEDIFARLAAAGVGRSDLVLAFDFVVGSDQSLTGQMLSMRDQSFAWLAQQAAAGTPTFTVIHMTETACAPGTVVWREVQGTFMVPLFLSADPVAAPASLGVLDVDRTGTPVQNGFTQPPFTIAIPCSVLGGGPPALPMIAGHGLFGDGHDFVEQITSAPTQINGGPPPSSFTYIVGGTDWLGLSAQDIAGADLTQSFVGKIVLKLDNFPALPDRLRQGQLDTLVLARMLKLGLFNADPAFQTPGGAGVLPGPQHDEYYFGGSLGGIMGLMFAALSPDAVNVAVDVPAINFSFLLQRATPYIPFQQALQLSGLSDPMDTALALGLVGELWVRGESAGYATHITANPLPGTNVKHVLMEEAWFDQQVSNQGTEIAARTLGLPNLAGSLRANLPLIPDMPGPLTSALEIYDTGAFDPNTPADVPFIPPLANLQAMPNQCDPHTHQGYIPAAELQLQAFLQPDGQVENFCNGLCDADEPLEIPFGNAQPCDPLAPQ